MSLKSGLWGLLEPVTECTLGCAGFTHTQQSPTQFFRIWLMCKSLDQKSTCRSRLCQVWETVQIQYRKALAGSQTHHLLASHVSIYCWPQSPSVPLICLYEPLCGLGLPVNVNMWVAEVFISTALSTKVHFACAVLQLTVETCQLFF